MSSYLYFKDRKTADKFGLFIAIITILGILAGLIVHNFNQSSEDKNTVPQKAIDSVSFIK